MGKHGILAPQRQMGHSQTRIRIRAPPLKATTSGRGRHPDRIGRSPGPSPNGRASASNDTESGRGQGKLYFSISTSLDYKVSLPRPDQASP